MHNVEITATEVKCSCGYQKDTLTRSEAMRLGYVHAGACQPSEVINTLRETPEGL